jgi:hypothetical protein
MTDGDITKARQRGTLEASIKRRETEREHEGNDDLNPVEAPSVEDLCLHLKSRLEQHDLIATERDDILDKLKRLRERPAELDRSER